MLTRNLNSRSKEAPVERRPAGTKVPSQQGIGTVTTDITPAPGIFRRADTAGNVNSSTAPGSPITHRQFLQLQIWYGNRYVQRLLANSLRSDVLQRQPVHTGTNWRFDTYRVTTSDLSDPAIVARFQALTLKGLLEYQKRVSGPAVVSYIAGLITKKRVAQKAQERLVYLAKVNTAISQLDDKFLAKRTHSEILLAMYQKMAQDPNVFWKDEKGVVTPGKSISYRFPGKTAKKITLKLVLDETVSKDEKRNGYYDPTNKAVTLIVNRLSTVDDIRGTLYHEGMHLLSHVIEDRGKAELGDPKDVATKGLALSLKPPKRASEIVKFLAAAVNSERSKRTTSSGSAKSTVPAITSAEIDKAAKFLWEEIVVRAETYYFETYRWIGLASPKPLSPQPPYLSPENVKAYLKYSGVFTDKDISGLPASDEKYVDSIQKYLRHEMRMLMRRRGVPKDFIPHPMDPNPIDVDDMYK